MKKILSTLLVATLAATFAQAIQIELTQKVSRDENSGRSLVSSGNYIFIAKVKTVARSKIFNIKISNTTPIEVVAIFFSTTGKSLYSDILDGSITPNKPLLYEHDSGVARSAKFFRSKTTYGNNKVEACVFVYEKNTCKLLGQKATSNTFADAIMKEKKSDMIEHVKSLSQENQ